MHVVALMRDFHNGHLFNHFMCEKQFNSLVGAAYRGALTAADKEMLGAYHHHIAAFQRCFLFVVLARTKKMLYCLGNLEDVIPVAGKQRMVKKYVSCQQRLPGAGFLCRFIEQHIIIDGNAYISRKNEIWDRSEDHLITVQ